MASKKRYTQYSQSVNDFGNSAYQVLKDKLVDVPAHQAKQLDEAVFYMSRAEECRKIIEKDGLTTKTAKNIVVPHPLIKVEKDAIATTYKLMGGLMLTLSAIDKARHVDHSVENKALEALLNG